MANWEEIKIQIKKETQRVFQNISNFNASETISLFEKVLLYPLNMPELKLDGLETRVPNALDKILVETDCPYLTPPAEGKDKRNEPIFIKSHSNRI